MPAMSAPAARDTCTFEHPLFPKLGEVVFRPAEADGTPVLVMPLGKSTAALPLRSLQAELGIEAASPDGQMFALIGRALDFVAELRLGDPLPVEVLGGEASWTPDPVHVQVAAWRLKLRLVAAGDGGAGPNWVTAEPMHVLQAMDDPALPERLHAAYIEAAATLGLPDAASVAQLVDQAAAELGFVEALRDRLLRRVLGLIDRVEGLLASLSQNLSGIEMVSRVLRLSKIAAGKIRARFDELDACVQVLPGALRDLGSHRPSIRLHRDWLYCSLRAWGTILAAWEGASTDWADGTWSLLSRTYRFLAPRFMPMQEWHLATRTRPADDGGRTRMVW